MTMKQEKNVEVIYLKVYYPLKYQINDRNDI